VNVRQGDPHSVAKLREALAGHHAVLSALGPPGRANVELLVLVSDKGCRQNCRLNPPRPVGRPFNAMSGVIFRDCLESISIATRQTWGELSDWVGRQSSAMAHAAPSRPCRPKACGDF
jgi:hypothetical protein